MTSDRSNDPTSELIRLAERYPFARPAQSYVYRSSASAELEPDWRRARTAVLAIGANASPERLSAKFPEPGEVIPVERARLHGFAIVYAAHFASYGAIPATLYPEPDAVSEVFVTWLSGTQLGAMHRSEGVGQRYAYRAFEQLTLEVDGGPVVRTTVAGYVSRFGALARDERPVRLTAIASTSTHPALDQRSVLDLARRRLAPGLDHVAFMSRIVACFGYRTRQTTALARDALRWPHDHPSPGRSSCRSR